MPLLYFDALEKASEMALTNGTSPSITQLVDDISSISSLSLTRVTRVSDCPRDKTMHNKKWYILASLPELTICDDCFEEVVYPRLSESPSLTEKFSIYAYRVPIATCQLYSERMRALFEEACRRKDLRQLEDAVIERKNKEVEIQAKLSQLKAQPQNDPWIEEAVKKLEQLWKKWE